jgi:hypothetical protein
MSTFPKTYRVYCYDGVHKMVSVEEIHAATDQEAIAHAEAKGYGSKCEIWDGRRMVAQLGEQAKTA